MTQRNEMPEEIYALAPTEDEPDKSYLTKPELIKGLVESDKEMGAMGALYIRADLAEGLAELVNRLLENGHCYMSAIELTPPFDGEEWEAKARAALSLFNEGK